MLQQPSDLIYSHDVRPEILRVPYFRITTRVGAANFYTFKLKYVYPHPEAATARTVNDEGVTSQYLSSAHCRPRLSNWLTVVLSAIADFAWSGSPWVRYACSYIMQLHEAQYVFLQHAHGCWCVQVCCIKLFAILQATPTNVVLYCVRQALANTR